MKYLLITLLFIFTQQAYAEPSITKSGGMMWLASLFNEECVNSSLNNDIRMEPMNYNELHSSTDMDNALGWKIIYNNIKFNLIRNPTHCSVSVGTSDGLDNISPFILLINKYTDKYKMDYIRLPVQSITIDNVEHRYQIFDIVNKHAYNGIKHEETWFLDYKIFHGANIDDSFIFDDTNTDYSSIRVTLSKVKL